MEKNQRQDAAATAGWKPALRYWQPAIHLGMKKIRTFIFISLGLLVFASAGFSQSATKKANRRPAAKKPVEPFEKATVTEMAEQCVLLETETGKIELEMYPEQAPETVRNFLRLVSLGFYDTTSFARVVPNFVVQGGNFGTRLSKPYELYEKARNIIDEPNLIKHGRGVLSMARGDEANSASTHFFILLNEAKYLDGKFSAFGRVIKGIEVVEAINKMPVVEEKPVKPVRLLKATNFQCVAKKEQ